VRSEFVDLFERGVCMIEYIAEHNVFVFPNTPEVAKGCPGAIEHNGYVIVPNNVTDLQIMVRRGINPVPMPMVDYDWPGRKPWMSQRCMANFMVLNPRCFVLSEMRTGKTDAALWAADYVMRKEGGKTLIVGQLSTLERVWGDAIFKSFLGKRQYVILHGSPEKRSRLLKSDVDFYIVNYEGLNIGAHRRKGAIQLDRLSREIAERADIQTAIIDEDSAYNDAQTLRNRVARLSLTPRRYLWLLTGTPTPNEPTDAYGLAKILNNAYGESFTSFKLRTMLQLGRYKWIAKKTAKHDVAKLLSPSIRFTQEDCFDARALVTMPRHAALSTEQSKHYAELQKQLLLVMPKGEQIEAVNEAALRSKLLQISCGEVYDTDHTAHHIDNTPRIEVLKEVIREAPTKVIVFAPFTSVLKNLVASLMPNFATILVDGSVTGEARNAALKKFQDRTDPVRVLCAHPGPVARGLDLTSAATVVWFSPTDKPEDYTQANERINGPHQTHARTIVHISATPVEREIYRRLEAKESLAGAIMKIIEERRHK
jgi:SNF2 family DNA or RNA helicase